MYKIEHLPSQQELEFVERLRQLAEAGNWDDWHAVRMVYSDYLEEIGDPRAWITRASWQRKKKDPTPGFRDAFLVYRPVLIPVIGLPKRVYAMSKYNAINAWPILHFAAGELRVVDILTNEAYYTGKTQFQGVGLTWHRNRKSPSAYDIGYLRGGLPSLFMPEIPCEEVVA